MPRGDKAKYTGKQERKSTISRKATKSAGSRRKRPSAGVEMDAPWEQVQDWLACESTWVPEPTERHAALLGDLLKTPGVHGNLVPMHTWPRWP
jgi:hypothetical protein